MKLPETPDDILRHIGIFEKTLGSKEEVNEAMCRLGTLMQMAAEVEIDDLYSRGLTDLELAMLIQDTAVERWGGVLESLIETLVNAEEQFRLSTRAEILRQKPMA